jgi:hypothetical protein
MVMTRDEFIEYLIETLIPDLRASGHYATANDFAACVTLIRDPNATDVEIGQDD